MSVSTAKIIVKGRVQGVFYRHSTKQAAAALGLFGFVRNLADGSVEAFVAGDRTQVEKLIEWCRVGPPSAQVSDVLIEWDVEALDDSLNSFEIR